MKTKHAAYSVYKKKVGTRNYWYVRFWDAAKRDYTVVRSTGVEVFGKKGRRDEAVRVAQELLPKIIFGAAHTYMVDYLKSFWSRDCPYFKESEFVRKKKLSEDYIRSSQDIIRLHIAAYEPFGGLLLSSLSPAIIRDFMLWAAERGMSGSRINRALQVMRIPMRYALERDEVPVDPFMRIKEAAVERKNKGVLTRAEVKRLLNAKYDNAYHRLAILLGLLCGMRLGEVRGLHWEDIDYDNNLIYIKHNWQNLEGVKPPKCGSFRDVPIIGVLKDLLLECQTGRGFPKTGLVFSREKDNAPYSIGYFRLALNRELTGIGIQGCWVKSGKAPEGFHDKVAERNISFHSLRHTFVSLSRLSGLNASEVQALAGHKSSVMMDNYDHPDQVVEKDHCRNTMEGFFAS